MFNSVVPELFLLGPDLWVEINISKHTASQREGRGLAAGTLGKVNVTVNGCWRGSKCVHVL